MSRPQFVILNSTLKLAFKFLNSCFALNSKQLESRALTYLNKPELNYSLAFINVTECTILPTLVNEQPQHHLCHQG